MALTPFVQHLSTGGDGTGTTSIVADYSVTAETFEIANQSTDASTTVSRIVVYVQDTGSLDMEKYGNGVALTNGLTLQVLTSAGALLADLTPTPITANGHWGLYCFDADVKTWGVGDEALMARWTFAKFTHQGEGVVLTDGERLVLTANDDFTPLVDHYVTAQGFTSVSY